MFCHASVNVNSNNMLSPLVANTTINHQPSLSSKADADFCMGDWHCAVD